MGKQDTIAAIATAPGRGGVGVIRISGTQAKAIAGQMLGRLPAPRQAMYARFRSPENETLDQGIALFFPGPHSFTGEDVLELQGHGGPVILDLLLQTCVQLGARLARPGEFSERAFLNDKIDLAQAEAIADLIDSQSRSAAKLAMRSLDGEFSRRVQALVEELIYLRMYVEAAIDFPEEEIDFLSDGKVRGLVENLLNSFAELRRACEQGALLREGIRVVIAGKPNAGKSSLLNALCGRDAAIVTDIPGTTRDVLREHIVLDGLPVHLVDTAGLRETADAVEQIGIARAQQEINRADYVLLIVDGSSTAQQSMDELWPLQQRPELAPGHCLIVRNKCDQSGEVPGIAAEDVVVLSAQTGAGISDLIALLKQKAGMREQTEGLFLARRRHITALDQALAHVELGANALLLQRAGDLLAEELRIAQQQLNEITGEFSSDDLLGRIFASFCIGK